jgi:hypothetical protein
VDGVVPGDPARVPGRRREADDAREPVRRLKDAQVPAGGSEEFCGEDEPEAGHAQKHLCVLVFGDFLADQRIEFGQFLVQGEDFPGEGCDDPFPMCWVGTMVCWDFAASTAAVATAAEERAPCFFGQVWILAWPARRMPERADSIAPAHRQEATRDYLSG